MNWKRTNRKSILFRLMSMVTALMVVAFLSIIVVFNLLFTRYIESTATELLSLSSQNFGFEPTRENVMSDPDERQRESNPAFAVSVQRTLIDDTYNVIIPTDLPTNFQQDLDAENFVQGLESEQVDLAEIENARLEWDGNLYYYTLTETGGSSNLAAAYFINMTDLYNLELQLNQLLIFVMIIVLVISLAVTYLISSKIAKPMRSLALFAKRIGEGEYETNNNDFTDLEMHELKEAMNETTSKLQNYDSEQRAFFQNASHELRTPLQIIKNTAEGIEYNIISEKKGVEVIKNETDKLSDLVEDILFLSRLESKSSDRVTDISDLRETFSYTVERYSYLFKQNGIEVAFDFQEEPVFYKYDEREFERVFQNLLSNAMRYSKGSIKVGCKEKGDRIILTVFNNGEGISEKDLPHIFDRFYFGDKGVHGIGLTIVKSIVSSYGGRIEASSTREGTLFSIFLNKPLI